jgi:RNase adaptor protein for sRNA GlmZ degradation
MIKARRKLSKRVRQLLKQNNIEEDLIDSSLSEEEILNQLKEMGITEKELTTREEYFNMLENELREKLDQELEELKTTQTDIDVYYEKLRNCIEVMLNSNDFNLLIVSGNGGMGKTVQIKKFLCQMNADFSYLCGHTTPYQLYRILYENSDKVIVFDDCNPILENTTSISLLLQACDTRKLRVVMWNTSKKTDISKRFEFNGKIIIITNKSFEQIYEPLLSRSIKCEVNFDNYTMLKIIAEISKGKPYSEKIIGILRENIGNVIINLRLYKLLVVAYMVYEKEKRLNDFDKIAEFIIKLEANEHLKLCYELLKNTSDIKKALKTFIEETGCHKSTFYRYKKIIEQVWLNDH